MTSVKITNKQLFYHHKVLIKFRRSRSINYQFYETFVSVISKIYLFSRLNMP